MSSPPNDATTLVHALMNNAKKHPKHVLLRWVNPQCEVDETITYEQLWERSGQVAAFLLETGIAQGDRVMIAYPFRLDFLSGLFGCMRIGAIACSVYPPNFSDKSKAKFTFEQFNNQAEDAGAKFALTTRIFKRGLVLAAVAGHKTNVKWLATDKLKASKAPGLPDVELEVSDTAFIQYSSGSTGAPKGVVITHGAAIHNIFAVSEHLGDTGSNQGVCWLPAYHDYALICVYLLSCVTPSMPVSACSPLDFIRNPLLWADMIEKFDATHIAGPNFAYGLLAKRMKAAGRRLEKSTLYRANIAAEPIAPSTIDDMREIGIPVEAINPCYGLAEVCAYGAMCVGDEVRVVGGVVSCGLLERTERWGKYIRVASEDGIILDEDTVGEIYLRGPDLTAGYWNKPETNRERFGRKLSDGEEYYATGDLGKIVEGRLFVVGRLKELIIINGRNFYPQDIERVIEAEYPDIVRPGSVVGFQFTDANVGISLEIRNTAMHAMHDISDTFSPLIRRLVSNSCGVTVGYLALLKQGCIPKTTSGKLRRVEVRKRSLEGDWRPSDLIMLHEAKAVNSSSKAPQLKQVHSDERRGAEWIIKAVIGHDTDMFADWEDNGLTSLEHAELVNRVQEQFQVSLPLNFQEKFPTPDQLRSFIDSTSAAKTFFPVTLPNILATRKGSDFGESLNVPALAALQAVGVCLLFLIFALSLIPSFYVGQFALRFKSTFEVGANARSVSWSWLPVVVPIFFVTFSVVVILLKWLVVGRYRTTVVDLPSVSYLRWWFVDRLMDLWELFIGNILVETKLIWLFYRLMGARLDWSCQVDGFIREFDLVQVGAESSIKHNIRCRKFSQGDSDSVELRPIQVGHRCSIEGMIQPGAKVGNSSKVNKFSVVSEGSQVPANSIAEGSPAYNAGRHEFSADVGYWEVEALKVASLVLELYHFFGLFLLAQMVVNEQLPLEWRYTPLLTWVLLLLLASSFGILTSIPLKWLLIGRRRSAEEKPSSWRRVAFWFCDFHFRLVSLTMLPLIGTSKIWNGILFLHGLDIDFASIPSAVLSLPPSKVDVLHIRRSFLSTITIDGSETIEIVDSSVGFGADLRGGVKIHRSIIPPRTVVSSSIYDATFQAQQKSERSMWLLHIGKELVVMPTIALAVISSFIPSYELFVATIPNAAAGVAVFWLFLVLIVQCISWICVERLLQALLFSSGARVQRVIYFSYALLAWRNHTWNLMMLSLRGTPFMSWLLCFMGSRVEGTLWYFGTAIYDFPMLTFRDRTIIDDAHVSGHYVVFDKLSLQETQLEGVVHPGTYCPGGSTLSSPESGPWKVYLGGGTLISDATTKETTEPQDHDEMSDDEESFSA